LPHRPSILSKQLIAGGGQLNPPPRFCLTSTTRWITWRGWFTMPC